jgi:hypothetical protein
MAGVLAALTLADCEYFNKPLRPFIDIYYAKVTLDAVNFGEQLGGGG